MEIMSSRNLSGSLSFTPRRIFRSRYVRLNVGHRKKMKTARLGGGSPVRAWRIRASARRRVKIVLSSPIKLLRSLKNLYLTMILKLAGEHGEKRITKARHLPIARSTAEFNDRLLLEIYKSFAVSREMSTG